MSQAYLSIAGTSDQIKQYLSIAINEILYVRKIHGQKYFSLQQVEKTDGIMYHMACIKSTQDYLLEMMSQLQKWLNEKKVDAIQVNLMNGIDHVIIETWNIKIIYSDEQKDEAKQFIKQIMEESAKLKEIQHKCVFDIIVVAKDVAIPQEWAKIE